MSAVNDGGPAFPTAPVSYGYAPDTPGAGTGCGPGMSLRDWFAGQEHLSDLDHPQVNISAEVCVALAGRKAPDWENEPVQYAKWEADWRASLKYIRADAMLRAKEAKP